MLRVGCKTILFIFVLLECAFSGVASDNENHSSLEAQIEAIFNKMKMTGLGIAVVKGDSIVYVHSWGYKEVPTVNNQGILLKNDDLFRIASVSKTFVATTILQLVEEGVLNLDDDVQKFLKFPLRNPSYRDKPITVRMLLTHTSSINDSQRWWSLDIINPIISDNYAKCFSETKPGMEYKYCNYNYLLLGAVIEGATGNRFDTEIDSRIMKPLDIQGGFNCNLLDSTKFVRLYRYNKESGAFREDDEAYRPYRYQIQTHYTLGKSIGLVYPDSGMKITTTDLAKYMMMHMKGGTLRQATILSLRSEMMMRENYVGKNNYGFAFRQYRGLVLNTTLYGQTGGGFGLKSAMIFDPKHQMGFVIICSGSASEYIDGYNDIHKPLIKLLYNYFSEND